MEALAYHTIASSWLSIAVIGQRGPRTAGTETPNWPQVKVNGPILNARHLGAENSRN